MELLYSPEAWIALVTLTLLEIILGVDIPKGYIYFAMAFSVFVEILNMKLHKRQRMPVQLRTIRHEVADGSGSPAT